MSTYLVSYDENTDILKIGFNSEKPSTNDVIVKDAVKALDKLNIQGGRIVKVNGAASLPVTAALTSHLKGLFSTIAFYDPKLVKYVVAVTTHPSYQLGDLVD
jgi:CRISPR-associated protein Csx3